jgi:hypothetical protein
MKNGFAFLLALLVLVCYTKDIFTKNWKDIDQLGPYTYRYGYKINTEDLDERIKELEDELMKKRSFFLPNPTPKECERYRKPFLWVFMDQK